MKSKSCQSSLASSFPFWVCCCDGGRPMETSSLCANRRISASISLILVRLNTERQHLS